MSCRLPVTGFQNVSGNRQLATGNQLARPSCALPGWRGEGPGTDPSGAGSSALPPKFQQRQIRISNFVIGPRQLFRRFFPRLRDPLLDADFARSADDDRLEAQYLALIDRTDAFVSTRYFEGIRWRHVLAAFTPRPTRVLDVGAGNGAIELAFRGGGSRSSA